MAEYPAPSARRPLVVVEGEAAFAAISAELAGAGWRLVEPPGGAPQTCTVFAVSTRAEVEAAVIAAIRGDGVVARFATSLVGDNLAAELKDDLLDDLTGIGPVLQPGPDPLVHLDVDTWRLVHQLADGTTLEAASRALNLSPRTASRRLTAARLALGAESRAQLVKVLCSPQRVPAATRV